MCPPRPGAVALLWLVITGCSGTIVFGANDTGQPPDSGEAPDMGGYPDAITYPDATVDAGDSGVPPCTPNYPMEWPHPRTVDYYWDLFGAWSASRDGGCGTMLCHGNEEDANRAPPYFPSAREFLNGAGRTTLAINELWASIYPGDSTSTIMKTHLPVAMGGLEKAPPYEPRHVQYLEGLLVRAADCPTPTVAPDAGELMPDAGDPDGGPTDRGPADI